MNHSCPMSFTKIDSNVSRFTSFLVVTLLITYLISGDVMILYILAFDFIVRLFLNKKNSFLNTHLQVQFLEFEQSILIIKL